MGESAGPKTKLQSDTSMQPSVESTAADRPAQRQQRQGESKIRGVGETGNITEQRERMGGRGGEKWEEGRQGEIKRDGG